MRTVFTSAERAFISAPNFGYMATILEDGSSHINCVWVDIEGDLVLVNSPTSTVKVRNLRRDSRVALIIADRNDPYRRLEVRGRAVEINPEGALDHIDHLARKYLGLENYAGPRSGARTIIRIRPDRINAHNF